MSSVQQERSSYCNSNIRFNVNADITERFTIDFDFSYTPKQYALQSARDGRWNISSGINTQSKIEAFMGEKSIGGQLSKLETVYDVIKKCRPIFAKDGSQTVRYEVSDNFLCIIKLP